MFVLGIDHGLSVTGYGVIETSAGAMIAVTAGVIRTDPDHSTTERLLELADDLRAVVAEHSPDVAAVEEVFVNRNLRTAMAVARASGVILLTLASAGLSVTEYTPSAVKLAVTGAGDADKSQVQTVVARRLGLAQSPRPADAADALAIAMCHAQHAAIAGARR